MVNKKYLSNFHIVLTMFWTIASLSVSFNVSYADNSDCGGRANYLKTNFNNAWRNDGYRDHEVLREGWNNSSNVLRYPNCDMTYDEYFFGKKERKQTAKAKPRKKTVITRNSDEGPADTVNVDPNPDWADDTRKRILKGKGADTVEVNLNPERRAPYGSSACAEIKPKPNRGKIDWDWVVVRNTCSYPIQVLTCYYDVGRDADCKPSAGARGWGLSGTIAPGQSVDSVSTSKAWPWFVKTLVCDMRQGTDLWCVLPK